MAPVFDNAGDGVRGVVVDLDAVALQTRKYLGCSYGLVVDECMVSTDLVRFVAAKRVPLVVERAC